MKKLLYILIPLFAVAAFIGYRMWNKPHMNVAEQESAFTINSAVLLKEFETDENQCNLKYLDKVIQLRGKVLSTEKADSTTIVVLDANNPEATVRCEMDPYSNHSKTNFNKGEDVTFKGICSGYLMGDVGVSRCVQVNK